MNKTPRTLAQVKNHHAVDAVEVCPHEEVKYWFYLKSGFTASNDPGQTHMGNGRNLKEAIEDTFPVTVCDCEDCNKDRQGVFMTTGHVTAVKPLAGSFKLVTVNQEDYTVGLAQDLTFPAVGDVIKIDGVTKDGKKLTTKWTRVDTAEQAWREHVNTDPFRDIPVQTCRKCGQGITVNDGRCDADGCSHRE